MIIRTRSKHVFRAAEQLFENLSDTRYNKKLELVRTRTQECLTALGYLPERKRTRRRTKTTWGKTVEKERYKAGYPKQCWLERNAAYWQDEEEITIK